MNTLNMEDVRKFVNENIVIFHNARLERLRKINLTEVLKKKNPYLFKAKHVTTASQLVENILDAFISSSEEKMFGDFLEELAIYVCSKVVGGHKASSPSIDLEFKNNSINYFSSVPTFEKEISVTALRQK